MQNGRHSITSLYDEIPVEVITPEQMVGAGLSEGELTNMNTPEDWARVTELSKGGR
jgi:molybdopterin-guanine dinucleotide biosynthesis protein A